MVKIIFFLIIVLVPIFMGKEIWRHRLDLIIINGFYESSILLISLVTQGSKVRTKRGLDFWPQAHKERARMVWENLSFNSCVLVEWRVIQPNQKTIYACSILEKIGKQWVVKTEFITHQNSLVA